MAYSSVIPWGKGAARGSKKEFIQFLYIALGSVSEVETQLVIACPVQWRKADYFTGQRDLVTWTILIALKSRYRQSES